MRTIKFNKRFLSFCLSFAIVIQLLVFNTHDSNAYMIYEGIVFEVYDGTSETHSTTVAVDSEEEDGKLLYSKSVGTFRWQDFRSQGGSESYALEKTAAGALSDLSKILTFEAKNEALLEAAKNNLAQKGILQTVPDDEQFDVIFAKRSEYETLVDSNMYYKTGMIVQKTDPASIPGNNKSGGEYRYAGYSLDGTLVNNPNYPIDHYGGSNPLNWNYIAPKDEVSVEEELLNSAGRVAFGSRITSDPVSPYYLPPNERVLYRGNDYTEEDLQKFMLQNITKEMLYVESMKIEYNKKFAPYKITDDQALNMLNGYGEILLEPGLFKY